MSEATEFIKGAATQTELAQVAAKQSAGQRCARKTTLVEVIYTMRKIHIVLLNNRKTGSRVLRWLAIGLLVLQMISVRGVVEAADGSIDPTFGSGGKVTSR